ncbi:MAG: peptide chain release factor 2 [Chloroflexi bacterium]|nr:peptide chain release factor 2 [Chloroflexota bacterium]MCI0887010.1 peptide chain release factor 2 [Chloroflexota bacterium]
MPSKEKQIEALEKEASEPSFWDSPSAAQHKMRRLSGLKEEVDSWRSLDEKATSLGELLALSIEEKDNSLRDTFSEELADIQRTLAELEFKLVLSGPYDQRNAIMALHAGAGGVESQDWASMLMRMYMRWAERRGYKGELLDVSVGEEAGIKSAVVQISGEYAYGYLKAERGVHRLVRISPFDSAHARHTSFALMEVMPEVEEGVDVVIKPDDLRIDVFRAGGAGGQSVQKNSTAVRITHLPTGIKVSCQNERSQHQNKEIAMRILMGRLVERELEEKAKEMAKLKGDHISPEWGNQIRSYVLHPYKMVKDHRTNFETSDADGVLDGDLDEFMRAYLTSTVGPD